ncbi:hypothetical protein EW146_g5460 [Bondarzewia mesenterica]|uniref:Pyruvate dehydrogenase E1 component subunit alpha n=1 Tax=Bondarzewia mesenterica TaxID=1095465 RepID=A0A4S4LRG8_9AGAM|nr:hypothetical protein EW146_g5460 [Bondarzewia mesenterica]
MTIKTINVATLKKVKNDVIGNPSAKSALAQDEVFVATPAHRLVDCLNAPEQFEGPRGSQDDIRIEAAQVMSSLSYGTPEALRSVLCANAHQAFLYAISKFDASESVAIRAAFARALRSLAAATAELVGPSQWGLHDDSSSFREEAKATLDYFFQLEVLDVYLPLLTDPSPQVSTSIAQLLGSTLRTQEHRHTVAEWLPPADRNKDVRSRRGWEKLDVSNTTAPGRQGGWVARHLTSLLSSRDLKVQEAALSALAALARDNYEVAANLAKPGLDETETPSALSMALGLCKTRATSVQLAASLCATHIVRGSTSPIAIDISSSLTIMHVMNRLIASATEQPQTRTKACFILNYLVTDEKELCQMAFDRGCLTKLAALVKSITQTEKASEWDEDEAESISCLREAALTAIAVLAVADNDIRCDITDNLHLIPYISAALSHRHVGVRYAACQCIRSLSRSVAVVRTSLVDSELGKSLYQTFLQEDEDRRVTFAALLALFLKEGLVKRLSQLLHSGYAKLRLNALWAVKNLLFKCKSSTKQAVMGELGWAEIKSLLSDPDPGVQEQAFHVLRNFASSEEDIELMFRRLGGEEALLEMLREALESKNADVVLQAAWVLCNLANGTPEHQAQVLGNGPILHALRSCLVDAPMEVRRAAVSCVVQLARAGSWRHQELREAGFDSTLRHICEYTGAVSPSALSANPTLVRSLQTAADSTQLTQAVPEHGSHPFPVQLHEESFHAYRTEAPSLEVEVTKDGLLRMYTQMATIRRMEHSADALYRSKLIRGFCHLAIGQEAVAVGLESSITHEDLVITSYRCHPFAVLRGGTVTGVLAELLGRQAGMSHGKGGSMHIFTPRFFGGNGIVGAQVPLGAGIAFTQQYLGKPTATFAMYGDGASNQGQVFEAFNMAKLWNLPCVFVIENNKYGMGTSAERSSSNTDYYTRGDKIPGIQANGMDIVATAQAVKHAREWVIAGKGPILLEFVTYRYGGHSMSDPGTTYRTREEVQRMRSTQDPIRGLQRYIEEWGVATPEDLKKIDKEAKITIDNAVEEAKASPEPPIEELWTDIYYKGTEPPFMRGREREEIHYY